MARYATVSMEAIDAACELIQATIGDPHSPEAFQNPLREVWAALSAIHNDTDVIVLEGHEGRAQELGPIDQRRVVEALQDWRLAGRMGRIDACCQPPYASDEDLLALEKRIRNW